MKVPGISSDIINSFDLKVNNSRLSSKELEKIVGISVTKHISPPDKFSIEVYDPEMEIISYENKDNSITEGSLVELYLGNEKDMKRVMLGEVSIICAEFSNNSSPVINIEGYDLFHRFTRGTCYRRFEGSNTDTGKSDSDIVTEIASEAKLRAIVDVTPELERARVQNNVSNYVFLNTLAEINGFYLWVEGEELFFKKERPKKEEIKLEWGENLFEFNARLSTAGLVNSIVVQGWDEIKKERFSYSMDRSTGSLKELSKTGKDQLKLGAGNKSVLELYDARIYSVESAKKYAEKLMEDQESFITASCTTTLNPEIEAGSIVSIKNTGRFSGKYLVEEVTHFIGNRGFKTSFQARKKV